MRDGGEKGGGVGRGGDKGGGVGEGRREIRKKMEEGGGEEKGEGREEGGRRKGEGGEEEGEGEGKREREGMGKDKSRQGKHILNLSGHHHPHETKLYTKEALPAMFPRDQAL